MTRMSLALVACLVLGSFADAGPIRRAIQNRRAEWKRFQCPSCASSAPAGVACLNCDHLACKDGTCACYGAPQFCGPAACPVVPQPMAGGCQIINGRMVCPKK